MLIDPPERAVGEEGMTPEQLEARIRDRGDCSDLVGTAEFYDQHGRPIHVPILDDDGREILGVAPQAGANI